MKTTKKIKKKANLKNHEKTIKTRRPPKTAKKYNFSQKSTIFQLMSV